MQLTPRAEEVLQRSPMEVQATDAVAANVSVMVRMAQGVAHNMATGRLGGTTAQRAAAMRLCVGGICFCFC